MTRAASLKKLDVEHLEDLLIVLVFQLMSPPTWGANDYEALCDYRGVRLFEEILARRWIKSGPCGYELSDSGRAALLQIYFLLTKKGEPHESRI